MTNKFNRFAAKLTTAAMVVSMVATAMPASAANLTSVKDTITRAGISVAATHSIVLVTSSTIASAGTITITLPAQFGDWSAAGTTATSAAGTFTNGISGKILTVTCVAGTDCTAGTITVSGAIAVNPSSAASYKVTIAGTGGISGSYALGIVDSDQVTVSAVVDPFLSFDIDTNTTTHSEEAYTADGSTYTVNLGTLDPNGATPAVSGASIEYIYLDLDTNATAGATVTVKSLNSGLKSASVTGDIIASATETLANDGTTAQTGYGLCVNDWYELGENSPTMTKESPFNGTCASYQVGGVSDTAQAIVTTSTMTQSGLAEISVQAAVNVLTPAHNDYYDVLTFVATATF